MRDRSIPASSPIRRIEGLEPICHFADGGMAQVFLARTRSQPSRLVVIKTLPGSLGGDSDRRAMFVDEMRIASLLRHPSIVELVAADIIGTDPYIVLELVDGPSLREMAARARMRDSTMDVRLAVSIAVRVCEGVHHAHELKSEWGAPLRLVHRDVSPQNVMVDRQGRVTILDFGVARAVGQAHETATRGIKGKISYTAPEYIRGVAPDRRADIFALGVVLWELVANRRLFYRPTFPQTMQAVVSDPIQPPSELNEAVPLELDTVILTALARDQEERWISARAMRDALARAIRHIGGLMSSHEIRELLRWDFPDLVDPATELLPELSNDELTARVALRSSPQGPKKDVGFDGSATSPDPPHLDGPTEVDVVPPPMDEHE